MAYQKSGIRELGARTSRWNPRLVFLKRDSGPQYDQVELGTQDCTVETRDPGFQKFQVEAGTRDP